MQFGINLLMFLRYVVPPFSGSKSKPRKQPSEASRATLKIKVIHFSKYRIFIRLHVIISQKTVFFMFITSCYHPFGLAGIEFVDEMLFFTCLLTQNTTENKTTPITSCIMICKCILEYDKLKYSAY
jgi:hypothetical protein